MNMTDQVAELDQIDRDDQGGRTARDTVQVLRRIGDVPLGERFCILDTPRAGADGQLYFGGRQVPPGTLSLPLHCQAYYSLGKGGAGMYAVHVSLPFQLIDVGTDPSLPAIMYAGRSVESRFGYAVPLGPSEYKLTVTAGVATLSLETAWLDDAHRRQLELKRQEAADWASRPETLAKHGALPKIESVRNLCARITPVAADTPGAVEVPAAYIHFYQWLVTTFGQHYQGSLTTLKRRQLLLGLFTGSTGQLQLNSKH